MAAKGNSCSPSFGYLAKQLQRRRYLEVDQSETRTACGAIFINGSELIEQSL
jgi:hypothetical protein